MIILQNIVKMVQNIYNQTDKNDIIALEINSHPGFTTTSIVPEIAMNAGIKYEEIVEMLVKNAKFGC